MAMKTKVKYRRSGSQQHGHEGKKIKGQLYVGYNGGYVVELLYK